MATIQDIPSTEAPATSRGKIVANFNALNDELVATTAAVAGKAEATHVHAIGDTSGLQAALAAKAPAASPTLTGKATFSGHTNVAQTTMSGTEIDVTKLRQALTVSSNPTLTFSATPTAGDVFGVQFVESGGVDRTITIPSSFSSNRGAAITSFTLPANARNYVQWYYDGTTYFVAGDPVTAAQQRTALSLGGAALLNVGTTAGTVAAGDDARLSDARTPTAHNHSAADITSGILPVARGGTGTATPGLVAGTNITVVGTWPNQTINSTGGGGGSSAHVMSGGIAATSFAFLETIAGGSASTDFTNLPVVHGSNASVSFA